ncbi:MAG: hypothetical protein NTV80_12180 [Verrucomicrobia bacterium]|nr:hypothetical protein [Verrucomicrobiota bacterium]
MSAKQSQAPERAEGKPLPERKFLMEVSAEERHIIELLRGNEPTLAPEALNHGPLKKPNVLLKWLRGAWI